MTKKIKRWKRRKDGHKQRYNYKTIKVKKKGKIIITRPGKQVRSLATRLKKELAPYSKRIEIAGSIRRKVMKPNDVDFVIIPKDKDKIKEIMRKHAQKVDEDGPLQFQSKVNSIDVDLFFTTPKSFGAEMMTRTGPYRSNIGNRTLAKNKGMLLNQKGLFKNGKMIAGKTEQDIFKALGKRYKPPELRGKGLGDGF